MIDLCTLGTGGALPLPERGLSSLYVRINGEGFLIDCGENTQTAIRQVGWGFRHINGLLLTHYHADHCGGIPGLLLSVAKSGREQPFHIYGCSGLHRIIEGLCVVVPHLPYEVILHEFGSPQEHKFSFDKFQITAFPVSHSIPCYGYRIDLARPRKFIADHAKELGIPCTLWGKLQSGQSVTLPDGRIIMPEDVMGAKRKGISFLYATDTRPTNTIVQYGLDTDLMILEGMYGDDEKIAQAHKNRHMLFREAAKLAKDAGTQKLLLTHFSNCIDDPLEYLPLARDIFFNTDAAADLLTLSLGWQNSKE